MNHTIKDRAEKPLEIDFSEILGAEAATNKDLGQTSFIKSVEQNANYSYT